MENKNIWKNWKFWAGIAVVLILVIIGIFYYVSNNQKTNINEPYNTIGKKINLTNNMKKELYKRVKEEITDSLKTPSTAIFPEMKEWDIDVNLNNVIEVKSYVDSQNSFGAMLRADFEQHYIMLDKNNYLCVYREFDNKPQFDITERAENRTVLNTRLNNKQVDNFIKTAKENQYNTLYNKIIDYDFNEEEQRLEWNIKVISQTDGDLKSNCYLALTSAIDECICIPTVTTTINVYLGDTEQKIATVNDINFEYMIKRWNILCDMGMNAGHLTTDLEEELGEKLIQEEIIKNMKVDYWNK